MRLLHIGDLHLGKRVNDFSMNDDQEYILNQIIKISSDNNCQGIIISGDVFDKSIPSEEAVKLFNKFLTRLVNKNLYVFIVSGNHDSAQRLSFASDLLEKSKVYISPNYNGKINSIKLTDEFGELNFWLLPFIKPSDVKNVYKDETFSSYTDAVRFAVNKLDADYSKRNIILAHQFVTQQDDTNLGGIDNVDYSVFEKFDYTALGHVHKAYHIGNKNIRYSGSPLKYSDKEVNQEKSVTLVDIKEKGNINISLVKLKPLHDMREIRGTYLELSAKSFYENTDTKDYIHVVLTDEEDVIDAIGKLRVIYENILTLRYDNKRTKKNNTIDLSEDVDDKKPIDMFEQLYMLQNNQQLSDKQKQLCNDIIAGIWEDEA